MTSLASAEFDEALVDTTNIGGVLQRVSDADVTLVTQMMRDFSEALLAELSACDSASSDKVQHRVRGLDASNFYTLEFQCFGTFVPSSVLERFAATHAAHVRDMRVCYPLATTVSLDTLRIEIDVWKRSVDATTRERLAPAYRHEVHAPTLTFSVAPRGATRAECDLIRRLIVYVQNMSLDAPSSSAEVSLTKDAMLVSLSNMRSVRVAFISALRAEFASHATIRTIMFESSVGAINELQIEMRREARAGDKKRATKAKATATAPRKRAKTRAATPPPDDDDDDDDSDESTQPPLPPPPAKSLFHALTRRILGA